jgi:PAS domain S-box-containing protein
MMDETELDQNVHKKLALRRAAEDLLAKCPGESSGFKEKTPEQIIHELEVNQIELEMQNDELKKVQADLQESRDKYEDLYDFAPIGYLTLTHKGTIEEVNLTGAFLLGLPRSRLIGRGFGHFVTPESLDQWDRHIRNSLEQEGKQGCDLKLKRDDGSMFYVHIESVRMDARHGTKSANDAPHVVRVAIIDITERRASEEAMRESEERWQFALEGARDGVWDWNTRSNEVFFSRQWKAMLGYEEHEIGNTLDEWDKRVHPEDKAQCYADIERHFKGQAPFYENEHRVLCKDGAYKWILDRGKVMEWTDDHQPLRVIGTHTDISERKRMEEALKQSEQEKFRTVADFTYDWEYWIDPAGALCYVSPSCERITGYRSEEFSQHPDLLTEIIHPEDKSLVGAHLSTIGLEDAYEIDFRIVTRKGEIRWIGHSCQPVYRDDGSWFGRRVSNRDITERKQIEEILKQRTKDLERSNKDLEQFAYVAAHDLREPLVAVASYLKVLERLSKNLVEDSFRKCIIKAMNLVLRMDAMLQGLLAYSRLSLTPRSYEVTDSNIALTDALSNLRLSIEKSGAIVTSDTLPSLKMDASQLVLIFQNLVGNAIKYRESEPLRIHVGCVTKESEHEFSVSDNGIGIEPPYLNRIFNMFERVKDLSGPSGTGIGLSTCRNIVERYGGRMWVESQPGKGSTFYFTIPNGLYPVDD